MGELRYSKGGRTVVGRLKGSRGFTIVELMVVIALFGIMLGVAVPSFNDYMLNSTLRSYANALALHSQLARSEAITRSTAVTVCVSTDGATCAGSDDWTEGWIVVDGAGVVLAQQQKLSKKFAFEEAAAATQFAFGPSGLKTPSGMTQFRICRSNPIATYERTVDISSTGRTAVKRVDAEATCP